MFTNPPSHYRYFPCRFPAVFGARKEQPLRYAEAPRLPASERRSELLNVLREK